MVKISFLDKKLDSRLCIAIFIPINRELAGSERERERDFPLKRSYESLSTFVTYIRCI